MCLVKGQTYIPVAGKTTNKNLEQKCFKFLTLSFIVAQFLNKLTHLKITKHTYINIRSSEHFHTISPLAHLLNSHI